MMETPSCPTTAVDRRASVEVDLDAFVLSESGVLRSALTA